MKPHAYAQALRAFEFAHRTGAVRSVLQGQIEASGPLASIGEVCDIETTHGPCAWAEVITVRDDHIVLLPLDPTAQILPGAIVRARAGHGHAPVGDGFAGRAVGPLGEAIDGGAPVLADTTAPLHGAVLSPMARKEPHTALTTGIRAIDALLPIGVGQRMGVFSASGVGKTSLIAQLAKQTSADRCILCLVGERGREVETIWRHVRERDDRSRFSCIAATSDLSAPLRARALHQALCLAEYWRDKGQNVLLIVDSITRYAMALREIGLAAGAPPTLRAYPPNVFAALPRIVERCGAAQAGGSITAFITVLSETDDVDDPIAEVMKSLLDGHILLSRQIFEQGRLPAIDVLRSVNRQSDKIMDGDHTSAARRVTSLLAHYEEARLMVETGIYKMGTNMRTDEAVREHDDIVAFLRQGADENADRRDTINRLNAMAARIRHA